MNGEEIPVNSKTSRAIGTWCAGLGFVSVASVFALWLFQTDPALRQQMILLALGCALACVVMLVLYQRNAGGQRSLSEVAVAEFSVATEEQRIPGWSRWRRRKPSHRGGGSSGDLLPGVSGGGTVLVGVTFVHPPSWLSGMKDGAGEWWSESEEDTNGWRRPGTKSL